MIIHRVAQGSPEWHAVRAGCITASNFKLARSRLKTGPNKGDFTEAAKDYAFRLAIERISKQPLDEGFETWSMRRGQELEPAARMAHEIETGITVEEVGFVTTDDGLFGASADGFIGEDGGAEYKCFVSPEKLRSILLSGDTSDVIDQCDGGMWITGRRYWEFCLYCPALETIGRELTIHRIERNDDRIETMEPELMQFAALVAEFETKLRQKAA
ncbi:lambda exonuclease family protein [Cupriavidus metallidurans]|uniref:lambda exonuclease family protein n=1 Tax=Cupriavidus metallidurans TaxID=119219 RepID=UPI001644BF52|nr:lambda exonuclease family protein [Cupriavidus metallidurans]